MNIAERLKLVLGPDAISKYCAEHPLPDSFVALMAERVRGGGALCCAAGREWLDGPVDAVWARVLSEWAYDALSCSEDRQERLDEYAQKVIERQFERRMGDD